MKKSELRTYYLEQRRTLSPKERLWASQKIVENFILQFNPIENQCVHCFLPIDKFAEIETQPLIDYCFQHHIRVFVPKMVQEALIAIELTPDTILQKNKWGIREPLSQQDSGVINFDYVITPLLYCDDQGNRVGYGKGFYDRLFQKVPPTTKKIGVNYFPPSEAIEDVWDEDIPLDYLITPTEVLSFGGAV